MHQTQARNALVQDLLEYVKYHAPSSELTNSSRYYKPTAKRRGSSGEIVDSYEERKSSSASIPGNTIPHDDEPKDGHDPTLASLAQLGCFLLDCEKSFISVLDNDAQYIIAEATKRASLVDPVQTEAGGEAPKGTRILDLIWDISLYALHAFTATDDQRNECSDNITLNKDIHIINDMSIVEGLKDRPFICGGEHMKYYAAVPIRSEKGVIGIYCVVDNKTRQGLDQKGIASLNEVASTIVQHLELLKNQHDLKRARGMVQGLGLFVEGKYGWGDKEQVGQQQPHETAATPSRPHASWKDAAHHSDAVYAPLLPAASEARAKHAKRTPSNAGLGPRERKLSVDETAFESMAPSGTMELFSRASNLIRQAIGLDGTMFIDGGFSNSVVDLFQPVPKGSSPETSPSKIVKGASTPDHTGRHVASSDLLGYSIRDYFNLIGSRVTSQHSTMPRATLRALLKDYWQGLIFFFDEDGTLCGVSKPGENLTDGSTETLGDFQRHEKKQEWVRQILDICPGARTVIFFPLWDPQRDRWSIGGLAWSNSPSRFLQADDITYLTAFGRCIMTEKSRLDAITADRAKANFISSVSHELRTPLHGVLASAEALQETSTTFTQDDLIRTISVCGEVLLDTTDQM